MADVDMVEHECDRRWDMTRQDNRDLNHRIDALREEIASLWEAINRLAESK